MWIIWRSAEWIHEYRWIFGNANVTMTLTSFVQVVYLKLKTRIVSKDEKFPHPHTLRPVLTVFPKKDVPSSFASFLWSCKASLKQRALANFLKCLWEQSVLVKHHAPDAITQGQGHKVANTDIIWNSFIQGLNIPYTLYWSTGKVKICRWVYGSPNWPFENCRESISIQHRTIFFSSWRTMTIQQKSSDQPN